MWSAEWGREGSDREEDEREEMRWKDRARHRGLDTTGRRSELRSLNERPHRFYLNKPSFKKRRRIESI